MTTILNPIRTTTTSTIPNKTTIHRQKSSGTSSLTDQIGNTPLIDLSAFVHSHDVSQNVKLYAKAEWFNPSGSVKARAALFIVEDALASSQLGPGRILIDSSSGNTGIAFAMLGAAKGFLVHLVMPANVSQERKVLARAYGATVIESDPLEGSDGAIHKVREIVASDPERYFYADQYSNEANWRSHYETTGPEIWRQTNGLITHYVVGLGTTGTFVGAGRYLKEQNSNVSLVAVQPEDELSVIEGLKHLETAIVPSIYDAELVDLHAAVGLEAAWEYTRALAREAGLFVGFSGGAAVAASIEIAQTLEHGVVVTIIPDDGSKYVSLRIFDES